MPKLNVWHHDLCDKTNTLREWHIYMHFLLHFLLVVDSWKIIFFYDSLEMIKKNKLLKLFWHF